MELDPLLIKILSFSGGHNTNMVLIAAMTLGVVAGLIGSFIFLRGRTLISDATSHACLPGVGIGFIVAFALGLEGGKHLPTLMGGAVLSGLAGTLAVEWIQKNTRLNDDVAIGTVLGVFYGLGIVLLSFIQRMEGASQAGLDQVLLGQVTGLTASDIQTNLIVSFILIAVCFIFIKDLCLLCFDPEFATTIGRSVKKLDLLLMILMLCVISVGLKTVGLILILALLIIPPVTARLWTERLKHMLFLSCFIGAISGYTGTAISAYFTNIPSGGAIVLSASAIFIISMIFAPGRGLIGLYAKGAKHV